MGDGLHGDAIKEIDRISREALGAKVLTINGEEYATAPVHRLDKRLAEAVPATIAVNTLQGLADFALSKVSEYAHERGGLFILVESPTRATLHTGIFGDMRQRACLAKAEAICCDFKFGNWYGAEMFTIALLSQFAPAGDRESVFRLTGAVDSGASITTADDGVSMNVTLKKGIQRTVETIGPGKTYRLAPFATFAEVRQPERPFILRVKPGNANATPPELHSCALIEADGGLWKLDAIAAIKDWLETELGTKVPVYG